MPRGVCNCTVILAPGQQCQACGAMGPSLPSQAPWQAPQVGRLEIRGWPLTEEQMREIVRQEIAAALDKALDEIRELKEKGR